MVRVERPSCNVQKATAFPSGTSCNGAPEKSKILFFIWRRAPAVLHNLFGTKLTLHENSVSSFRSWYRLCATCDGNAGGRHESTTEGQKSHRPQGRHSSFLCLSATNWTLISTSFAHPSTHEFRKPQSCLKNPRAIFPTRPRWAAALMKACRSLPSSRSGPNSVATSRASARWWAGSSLRWFMVKDITYSRTPHFSILPTYAKADGSAGIPCPPSWKRYSTTRESLPSSSWTDGRRRRMVAAWASRTGATLARSVPWLHTCSKWEIRALWLSESVSLRAPWRTIWFSCWVTKHWSSTWIGSLTFPTQYASKAL